MTFDAPDLYYLRLSPHDDHFDVHLERPSGSVRVHLPSTQYQPDVTVLNGDLDFVLSGAILAEDGTFETGPRHYRNNGSTVSILQPPNDSTISGQLSTGPFVLIYQIPPSNGGKYILALWDAHTGELEELGVFKSYADILATALSNRTSFSDVPEDLYRMFGRQRDGATNRWHSHVYGTFLVSSDGREWSVNATPLFSLASPLSTRFVTGNDSYVGVSVYDKNTLGPLTYYWGGHPETLRYPIQEYMATYVVSLKTGSIVAHHDNTYEILFPDTYGLNRLAQRLFADRNSRAIPSTSCPEHAGAH